MFPIHIPLAVGDKAKSLIEAPGLLVFLVEAQKDVLYPILGIELADEGLDGRPPQPPFLLCCVDEQTASAMTLLRKEI